MIDDGGDPREGMEEEVEEAGEALESDDEGLNIGENDDKLSLSLSATNEEATSDASVLQFLDAAKLLLNEMVHCRQERQQYEEDMEQRRKGLHSLSSSSTQMLSPGIESSDRGKDDDNSENKKKSDNISVDLQQRARECINDDNYDWRATFQEADEELEEEILRQKISELEGMYIGRSASPADHTPSSPTEDESKTQEPPVTISSNQRRLEDVYKQISDLEQQLKELEGFSIDDDDLDDENGSVDGGRALLQDALQKSGATDIIKRMLEEE